MSPDLPGRADSPLTAGGEGTPARGPSHDAAPAGWIPCAICTGTITLDDHRTARCWTDPRGITVAAHHDCLVRVGELDLDLPGA